MQTNTATKQVSAFSLESLIEFLDGYRHVSHIRENSKLEVSKDCGTFVFSDSNFETLESAEIALDRLFEFISPGDESVESDWVFHVERWEYANEFTETPSDEREDYEGQAEIQDFGPDL
jgi:hypothetical protein